MPCSITESAMPGKGHQGAEMTHREDPIPASGACRGPPRSNAPVCRAEPEVTIHNDGTHCPAPAKGRGGRIRSCVETALPPPQEGQASPVSALSSNGTAPRKPEERSTEREYSVWKNQKKK